MNNIKQILFLFNASFIIFSEILLYFFFRDKISFISRITRRLSSINILYVKVFQAIALNNSLIDDKINNELLRFTDKAPWTNDDIDYDALNKLKDEEKLLFEDGFNNPINSGMISLVYKAKMIVNGSNIIVKIKRKNIELKLNDAIDNLMFFMYIISFVPLIHKYQLAEVVNKNIDIIKHQVNFSEEVQNIIKIKENCKHLKYVKIPNVFKDVTENNPNIILMELIDGVTINNVKEEDFEGFAKSVLKFGLVTTLLHGATHGDLHCGNILFIKDENDPKYKHKIGVIDFGIIYEIDQQFKRELFNVITEMFNTTAESTAEKLLTSGIIEPIDVLKMLPNNHYKNILQFTTEILQDTIFNSKQGTQLQLYKFLSKFKNYISNPEIANFGIRPSDNFVKTQLVLAMAHGVTLTLCKDDYMLIADKVINELFHTNIIM